MVRGDCILFMVGSNHNNWGENKGSGGGFLACVGCESGRAVDSLRWREGLEVELWLTGVYPAKGDILMAFRN